MLRSSWSFKDSANALFFTYLYTFVHSFRSLERRPYLRRGFLLGALFLWINIRLSNLNQQEPMLSQQLTAVFASSLVIWFFSFSILGFALLYADKPNPSTRYLTGATVLITILTYNYFVRETFPGKILNGRKYPRGLPIIEDLTKNTEDVLTQPPLRNIS